jgi:predicted Fe-S protein YdhL (DUF1289 family)
MNDDIRNRNEEASPCVGICVIHRGAGICIGCYRTGDEIARWSAMDSAARTRLAADLPERAGQLARRQGGRKGRTTRTPR